MKRIVIVGSRDFKPLSSVSKYVLTIPSNWTVVSGGAPGVDQMAVDVAQRYGIPVEVYPADWENLGKRAGFIRNEQMVSVADKVVAFWNGESKGTKHTIDLALKKRLPLEVHMQ